MSRTVTDSRSAPTSHGGRTAAVELCGVSVRFGGTTALTDLSLRVEHGETVALLGPSGSGKSTALKAIAGFETPSTGSILLDGLDVTHLSPARRGIGVVVQSYALFPHMRVDANVAYGLRARRLPRAQIAERVTEMLRMVGMDDHARRLPRELSGGQQQRIAIARALAIRPGVLLLDEPLSALDTQLRQEMIGELHQLRVELPDIAMVYVTHDQTEALALADRIALMRGGRLQEVGTASQLYNRPRSGFTAAFLGAANLLPVIFTGALPAEEALVEVSTGVGRLRGVAPSGLDPDPEGGLCLAIRPHAWTISASPTANSVPAMVDSVQWRGADHRVHATILGTGQQVLVDLPPLAEVPAPGEKVWLAVDPRNAVLVRGTARDDSRRRG
jgi:2-aminoethylphosphonate transport system ATP-binding protein